MFRRVLLFAVLVFPGIAQDLRMISLVKGKVISEDTIAGSHLVVNLIDTLSHRAVGRAYLGSDGSFEFRDVPAGSYTVELDTSSGNLICQQTLSINAPGDQIEIRMPTRENKPGPATGTVSVRQLQHQMSAKSKRIFAQAQKVSAKGDYLKEIDMLRTTLNDASAEPHARMNIGVAYIKAGQMESAVSEFRQAVNLMPDDSAARTNLAYALLMTRHIDAAEAEGRVAVQLDRNNSKARWVMGSILLSKGSHIEEGVEDLKFASREIPKARMALAQFYERTGQKDAAARELREFLPQASGSERAAVEQWLSKLVAK